jgi:transcriptional regulator with XRE-family HTH domain
MHDNISSTSDSVPAVRLEDLSRLLRVKRKAERLTLEQVADKTGVSPATLAPRTLAGQSRSATGMPSAPDTRTLAAHALARRIY